MRKFFIFITLFIILCSIILLGWFYLTKTSKKHDAQVDTIKVQYKPPLYFTGTQSPTQLTNIFFNSDKGIISHWLVKNDNTVKKNQPLFEYYNLDVNIKSPQNKNTYPT
ncbi:hypothetical protein [Staphylococcus edaphicus]|uniref:hypothetical protein n=1 Tax=Staphylococcus edaphicus TaxID=1955013 RepID=UPI001EE6C8E1|nr:hypothetical protein [Staphylococcus edaphicus]